jgi:hypothetical protein
MPISLTRFPVRPWRSAGKRRRYQAAPVGFPTSANFSVVLNSQLLPLLMEDI